jgi:hypothetical protein
MIAHAMSVGILLIGVVEAIGKQKRAFLSTSEETYNGGYYKVAWIDVSVPKKIRWAWIALYLDPKLRASG